MKSIGLFFSGPPGPIILDHSSLIQRFESRSHGIKESHRSTLNPTSSPVSCCSLWWRRLLPHFLPNPPLSLPSSDLHGASSTGRTRAGLAGAPASGTLLSPFPPSSSLLSPSCLRSAAPWGGAGPATVRHGQGWRRGGACMRGRSSRQRVQAECRTCVAAVRARHGRRRDHAARRRRALLGRAQERCGKAAPPCCCHFSLVPTQIDGVPHEEARLT